MIPLLPQSSSASQSRTRQGVSSHEDIVSIHPIFTRSLEESKVTDGNAAVIDIATDETWAPGHVSIRKEYPIEQGCVAIID